MSVQGPDSFGSLTSDLTSILRIPVSDTERRPYQSERFYHSRSTNSERTNSRNSRQTITNNSSENDFRGFSAAKNENQDLETDNFPQGHRKTGYWCDPRNNSPENNENPLDFSGFVNNGNQNLNSVKNNQSNRHDTLRNSYTPHSSNELGIAGLSPANPQTVHAQQNLPMLTKHSILQQSPPRYPLYLTYSARKASYKDWPVNLKTAEEMADGGFFHATSSNGNDCVRCFQCGIGLRNWDPEDDPWVEHARWSSKCCYLREKKGQAFVDLVQKAVRQAQIEEALSKNSGNNGKDVEADSPPVTNGTDTSSFKPSPTERKNPLLTSAAQSVLDLGYLPRIVKKAVDEILNEKGWIGMTGTNILQVVLGYEEELQRQKEGYGQKQTVNQIIKVPSTGRAIHTIKTISKSKDYKTLLSENEELKEQKTCKICCEETVSIVFLPCGHLVCCAQCSPALKDCPVCRTNIKGTVRVCLADDTYKSEKTFS